MAALPIRHRALSKIAADKNINKARYIIKKWEVDCGKLGSYSTLFLVDREEAAKLLEATIGLQRAMNHYVKLSTTSGKLVESQDLMQIAMKRLKFEFYTLLSANRGSLGCRSFSGRYGVGVSETNADGVSENTARSLPAEAERAVEDLKSVSECMIACGYGKECVGIYQIVRKSAIDETLHHLGIEKLGHAQLKKMEWRILERRIGIWLRAVKIAIGALFCREKAICDAVFSSSARIAEACFAGISTDAAADLFAFAENVCKCKKALSPEKIFRLLDLYEAISDLWPDIQYVFSGKLSAAVISQAAAARMKLAEKIRLMLAQFEKAIRKDSSRPPPDGGVHPLTRYVMNFLAFLCDYGAAISNIVEDSPAKERSPPSKSSDGEADASPAEISRHLAWLILVLLCKLDSKAAAYGDGALSYLFMANNLNYVVSKVRSSDLEQLIGQDWVRKHELKVKAYLASYEKVGWCKVIAAVTPPSKAEECLEKFYASFQEACRNQRSWVIPDPKIRENVRISLAKRIVSGYRVLCKRGGTAGLNVRYTPEDLYNYLSNLFTATAS